jgi:hypothetical protein
VSVTINWREITTNPNLRELIIEDKPRADKFTGYTQIKITPSEKIENGIYIHRK